MSLKGKSKGSGTSDSYDLVFSNKTAWDSLCLDVRAQLAASGVRVWQQQTNIPKDSDNWFSEWYPSAVKSRKIVCFISADYLRSPYCMVRSHPHVRSRCSALVSPQREPPSHAWCGARRRNLESRRLRINCWWWRANRSARFVPWIHRHIRKLRMRWRTLWEAGK